MISETEKVILPLTFHEVTPEEDRPGLAIHQDFFRELLTTLLEQGFTFYTCAQAVEFASKEKLADKAAVASFDDALKSQADYAVPILKELGIPATFFVMTGIYDNELPNVIALQLLLKEQGANKVAARLSQGQGIGDAHKELLKPQYSNFHKVIKGPEAQKLRAAKTVFNHVISPNVMAPLLRKYIEDVFGEGAEAKLIADTFLSVEQLRELAGMGHEIAGHTVSHPDFTMLSKDEYMTEITVCYQVLEQLMQTAPSSWAYAFGGTYLEEVLEEVAKRFNSGWNFLKDENLDPKLLDQQNLVMSPYNIPRADAIQIWNQVRR